MDKLIRLVVQLQDEASAGIGKLNGTLSTMAGVVGGNLITSALQTAGQAVLGLGATTLTASADFESATARFASVAGSSLAEAGFALDDIKAKALDMGAQTQFSAAEALDAMIELAKGGVPVKDVMAGATAATLDLAAAGELGLATAAEIVSKQLGVWADQGVAAAEVSNLMAQAANASTVGVEDLALGMANVGGVAKVTGASFQETVQAMAMLAPGFSSASDAGTSLKTFLSRLIPTTSAARGAMSELGLMFTSTTKIADFLRKQGLTPLGTDLDTLGNQFTEWATAGGMSAKDMNKVWETFQQSKFFDLEGNFVGMAESADLLKNATAGLSEEQMQLALNTIFGQDAIRAAAIMAQQGAEGFDAMGTAMAGAGTAAEQAAIRNQTFKFAWDSLLGSIETFQIMVGGVLLPLLTALVNGALIPAVNAVSEFAGALMASGDPFAFLVAQINSVLPGFSAFVSFVQANFVPILAAIGTFILGIVVPAFIAWAAAAWASATATIAALVPILAIAAAVGLLVAAWQNNFLGIRDIVAQVWTYIEPVFNQLVTWLQAQIPIALQFLAGLWSGTLLPALQAVGAFITGTVLPILGQIASWLMTNIPIAIQAAVAAFQTIAGVVGAVVATIITVVQDIATRVQAGFAVVVATVQSVVSAFQTGWGILTTITQAVWNTLVFLVQAAISRLLAVVGPPIADVVASVQIGWQQVVSVTSAVWNTIVGIVGPVVATIVGVVSAGWQQVVSWTTSIWDTVVGVISGVLATLTGIIQGGWSTIETETSGVWSRVEGLITGIWATVQSAIATAVAIVETLITGAWSVIVAASENDFGSIPGIISGVWEDIKGTFNTGVEEVKKTFAGFITDAIAFGTDIVNGIVEGIGNVGDAIGNKLKEMAQGALNTAKSILGIASPSRVMAAEVGVPIVEGIAQGIGKASPKAVGAMLDLAEKLVSVVSGGVEAFGKLRQLGAVPLSAITQFADSLQLAMSTFGQMTLTWDKAMMSAASQFTFKSQQVIETMSAGVDFLNGLASMREVPAQNFRLFADGISQAMQELIRVSTFEMRLGLTAAVEFSTGAGEVIKILGAGVDGLNKLADLGTLPAGRMQQFAQMVVGIVFRMWEVSRLLSGEMVAAAGAFAEGAGRVLGIVGSGVDGLSKLADLATLPPGRMQVFAEMVVGIVFRLWEVSRRLSEDAVAAAGAFAEGAQKVLGVIGAGVDGLSKLADFQAPAQGAIAAFANSVANVVSYFWSVSAMFQQEGLNAAAAFSEAAQKVVGVVGAGVEGLSKLQDLGPVSQQSILLFGDALGRTMVALSAVAQRFAAEALNHAKTFADAAGAAVGILQKGVEGLLLLNTFSGTTQAAIDRFAAGVQMAVAAMVRLATQFGTEATAAANAFAKAAGESTDFLKKGVDGFIKLGELTEIPKQGMALFAQGIVVMINTIIGLANILSTDVLLRANQFSNAIDAVIQTVQSGLKALSDLGGSAAGLGQFTAALIRAVQNVAAALVAQAAPASQNIGVSIAQGIARGIGSGTPAIQNAVFAAVNAALAAARQALGIASPSKVFDELIGQQAGAGLAQGLERSIPVVAAAAQTMAAATITPAQQPLGVAPRPIAAGGGGGNTFNLTIAPGAIVQRNGENQDQLVKRIVAEVKKEFGLKA